MNEEMSFEVYSESILHYDVNTLFLESNILKVSTSTLRKI